MKFISIDKPNTNFVNLNLVRHIEIVELKESAYIRFWFTDNEFIISQHFELTSKALKCLQEKMNK